MHRKGRRSEVRWVTRTVMKLRRRACPRRIAPLQREVVIPLLHLELRDVNGEVLIRTERARFSVVVVTRPVGDARSAMGDHAGRFVREVGSLMTIGWGRKDDCPEV